MIYSWNLGDAFHPTHFTPPNSLHQVDYIYIYIYPISFNGKWAQAACKGNTSETRRSSPVNQPLMGWNSGNHNGKHLQSPPCLKNCTWRWITHFTLAINPLLVSGIPESLIPPYLFHKKKTNQSNSVPTSGISTCVSKGSSKAARAVTVHKDLQHTLFNFSKVQPAPQKKNIKKKNDP